MAVVASPPMPDVTSFTDVSVTQMSDVDAALKAVDWADPPKITIDFTPPDEEAFPPPSPRSLQTPIFERFAKLRDITSPSRPLKKRPAEDSADQQGMGNPPPKKPVTSRPACTHISMVKTYIDQKHNHVRCTQCGRVPSIGFIYACEQDKTHPPPRPSFYTRNSSSNSKKAKKFSRDKRNQSADSVTLDLSSLSPSVLAGIKKNQYTPQQVELLIRQKEHLMDVLAQAASEGAEEARPKANGQKGSNADDDLNKAAKSSNFLQKARRTSVSKSVAPCDYKVCHACRPNAREKSFMSFGHVLAGDITPITQWCPQTMPVMPLQLARSLGLREVPDHLNFTPGPTDETVQHTMAGGLDPYNVARPTTWSPNSFPRASASAEGFRQGLRKSLLDLLRMRLGAPSPASAPPSVSTSASTTPRDSANNSTTSTPGTEDDPDNTGLTAPSIDQDMSLNSQIHQLSDLCTTKNGEFDVELWRQMSQDVLAQAAALKLSDDTPTADTEQVQMRQQDLVKIVGNEEAGDLGIVNRVQLQKEQDILEEKLKALKETPDDEEAEHSLEVGKMGFGGLGLRLTEEAAESYMPDVIMKSV